MSDNMKINLMRLRHNERIQAETRLANKIQREQGCKRSDALKQAMLIVEQTGA